MGLNEVQKEEEIEKISWRENNPYLISDMNQFEDHFLLQGAISIIGLADPNKFKTRAMNFRKLFHHESDFIRISKALLTIGDYSQLTSWRFLLGNANNSTWRELFTIFQQ